MTMELMQSETIAAKRRVPVYLVDATDGQTPETGVAMAAGEGKVTKADGTTANAAGALTEVARGLYYYEYTAGELNLLGFVTFDFSDAGARSKEPVVGQVVVDARPVQGEVQSSPDDTHIELESAASSVDDYYNGWLVGILQGTGKGYFGKVLDYVGATRMVEVVEAFPTPPGGPGDSIYYLSLQ